MSKQEIQSGRLPVVEMLRLPRDGEAHDLQHWTVDLRTAGDRDERRDTATLARLRQLAAGSPAASMEDLSMELARALPGQEGARSAVGVVIESALWKRLAMRGMPPPGTWMHGSAERKTVLATCIQNGGVEVRSGFRGMVLLRAMSAWEDAEGVAWEAPDPLLWSAVEAEWTYTSVELDFDRERHAIREAMLQAFADKASGSPEQTLTRMGEAALAACAAIDAVALALPERQGVQRERLVAGVPGRSVFLPIGRLRERVAVHVHRTG